MKYRSSPGRAELPPGIGKKRFYALLAIGVVAAIFYWFAAHSPMMTDNFIFSRSISPGYAAFYAGDPITAAIPDATSALTQAIGMYRGWCGRFTGNLVVYLLFLLPAPFMHMIMAAGFGLLLFLLQICIFGIGWRQNLSGGWILATAGLLWAGIPSFGEAFFWVSVGGLAALLGQAAILAWFRLALDKWQRPGPGLACIICPLAFLGGAFVASLDYATSAALPATTLACACWLYFRQPRQGRKVPLDRLCCALGLCAGALATLKAPGNAIRMALTHDPAVHLWLDAGWPQRVLSWLANLPGAILFQIVPLIFLIWGCYWLWRLHGREFLRHFPMPALLFLLPALLTHAAYLFTPWPPARALSTTALQLVPCGCIVWLAIEQYSRPAMLRQFRFLRGTLCIFCAATLIYEVFNFTRLDALVAEREKILYAASGSATIPPLPPGTGDRYWVLGKYQPDLSSDPGFWVNRAMATYYGLEKVVGARGYKEATARIGQPQFSRTDAAIGIQVVNDRIRVEMRTGAAEGAQVAHVYYYGANALLNLLPHGIARHIMAWLGTPHAPAWLVPLLLARTDIALSASAPGIITGTSPILKIFDVGRLWLVRPGGAWHSLDLLPVTLAVR